MDLTIEQILQQGIAAHKKGKVQDAERLYQAILQSQPLHPDANHNLGVLAVSVNKADAALPLFKTALEVNPKIEQFWLSYIDALIKEKQFDDANQILEQAKKQGVAGEKLNALETQLILTTQVNEPKSVVQKKSQTLSEKRKKLAKNKNKNKNKNKKGKKQNVKDTNNALKLFLAGQYDDAEKLAVSITQEFPKRQFGWKILGAVLRQTGRVRESLVPNQKSVALSPQDAEAHVNLGVSLQELGRLDEAEASLRQAIALKPEQPEAHANLGVALHELGRLDEAEACYREAIALRPDYAQAHSNLGATLHVLGRLDEEISAYVQAIALQPNFNCAYVNLGVTIKKVTVQLLNRSHYPILINLLTVGNFVRPSDIVHSILSLLKDDPLIKDLLIEENVLENISEVTSAIKALDKLPLLHHLMRVCPLPDLQLESIFALMRKALLKELYQIEIFPELIYFLSTLSLHCFTNEYVYFESDEEKQLVDELEAKITQAIMQSEQPEAIKILCLASYRPLHQYDWCQKLEVLDHLEEVKKRLIEQPLAEKVIAKDIAVLDEISDGVSCQVRAQYEENPYPRWVKTAIAIKAKSIAIDCDYFNLNLHSESIKAITTPRFLNAGCATGQQAIETASRFPGCQVTAVDLSLASLAYAKRKTTEFGITNLEYLQADILKLDQLEPEFDIIESAGVLHHMDEPMAGWRVLTNLLKPGGLMMIGLYSELARSQVVKVRREIASLGTGTSATEIRNFRRSLIESHDENNQMLTKSNDFFTLSSVRDLIFHVKEHRFTLPQIKNCLDELGLGFCGFKNNLAISSFREFHGREADIYDLALWHQYEESNPHTFAGMYQFCCQKL